MPSAHRLDAGEVDFQDTLFIAPAGQGARLAEVDEADQFCCRHFSLSSWTPRDCGRRRRRPRGRGGNLYCRIFEAAGVDGRPTLTRSYEVQVVQAQQVAKLDLKAVSVKVVSAKPTGTDAPPPHDGDPDCF